MNAPLAEGSPTEKTKGKQQNEKDTIEYSPCVAALFAWAQVSETTTTTTTTEGNGSWLNCTFRDRNQNSSGPRSYHFGKTVTYVTRSGRTLDEEAVRTRVRGQYSRPGGLRRDRRQHDGRSVILDED